MSNTQHSSGSDQWFTPPTLLDPIKATLGTIDLDPASSEEANKAVGAKQIWTDLDDSLSFKWEERITEPVTVFLNPPSKGKLPGNKSWAATYWAKLMDFRSTDLLKEAIFLGFSLEQLAVTQSYSREGECMCDFTSCVPRNRTQFIPSNKTYSDLRKKAFTKHCEAGKDPSKFKFKVQSPTHSNIILYIPGIRDMRKLFIHNFRALGCILNEA